MWLTRDPAGFVDGPNLYAYVRQNPWTSFDPDGLNGVALGWRAALGELIVGGAACLARIGVIEGATAATLEASHNRRMGQSVAPVFILAGAVAQLLSDPDAAKPKDLVTPATPVGDQSIVDIPVATPAPELTTPATPVTPRTETVEVDDSAKVTHLDSQGGGRTGDQSRLRELGADDKVSSADRGWIKQEQNSIERGQRTRIRRPPGKELAHERGREAAKGYGYEHSNLQDQDLHKLQHKYDDFGRKNKERPITNGN